LHATFFFSQIWFAILIALVFFPLLAFVIDDETNAYMNVVIVGVIKFFMLIEVLNSYVGLFWI